MVDTVDSKSTTFRCGGSNPLQGIKEIFIFYKDLPGIGIEPIT